MNRPGQAQVEVVGPPDDIKTVKVGGTAVTVMTGQLTIRKAQFSTDF
jgi:predicted PhzF superfamily epimerase YddE/YHI9